MSWFATALQAVRPELEASPGLGAVRGRDRGSFAPEDPRLLDGSCDIDAALADSAPQEARWDYAVVYRGEVWFAEVHPAASGENLHEVVAKAAWLRRLVVGSELAGRSRGLFWLATGKVAPLPAFSRSRRILAQAGVELPRSRLALR